MGYALAGAVRHEGHEALLISGPTSLDVPEGVDFVSVTTAQQMYDAVRDMVGGVDVAILCAAVADYRPVSFSEQKIKKDAERMELSLERRPDILGSMRREFGFGGILVGFAAETQNLLAGARGKLEAKRCDMVVANDVSQPGVGFDASMSEVWLVRKEGRKNWSVIQSTILPCALCRNHFLSSLDEYEPDESFGLGLRVGRGVRGSWKISLVPGTHLP